MRASFLLALAIVGTSPIAAHSSLAAENTSSCGGVQFVQHLETIGFASNALKLLNGSENPKLRRLLEWRLGAAAEDAKAQLDRGAKLEDMGLALPTLSHGLRDARAYASSHQLPGAVIANLTALDAWVSQQPGVPTPSPSRG
jgi:hypothetical protein